MFCSILENCSWSVYLLNYLDSWEKLGSGETHTFSQAWCNVIFISQTYECFSRKRSFRLHPIQMFNTGETCKLDVFAKSLSIEMFFKFKKKIKTFLLFLWEKMTFHPNLNIQIPIIHSNLNNFNIVVKQETYSFLTTLKMFTMFEMYLQQYKLK